MRTESYRDTYLRTEQGRNPTLWEVLMRQLPLCLILAMACAAPGGADSSRTLDATVHAGAARIVILEAGVGEVEVVATAGDRVQARVELTPRRGGLFSSLRRSESDVADAQLEAVARGDEIRLSVSSRSKDRRFEEHWTVEVPRHLALDLQLGVGEAVVRGLQGEVRADLGVGDLTVEAEGGDVRAKVGVGDVDVLAPAAPYGPVTCSAGVGSVTLRAGGERLKGGGLLGNELEWRGTGSSRISAEAGVGSVAVELR